MICIEIMQEFSDMMNALSLLNVTDEEIERIVDSNTTKYHIHTHLLERQMDALEKGLVALRDLN